MFYSVQISFRAHWLPKRNARWECACHLSWMSLVMRWGQRLYARNLARGRGRPHSPVASEQLDGLVLEWEHL